MELMVSRSSMPLVGAAGLGAALMYLLDPERGARRRSMFEDRLVHTAHQVEEGFGRTRRDVRNHARGVAAVARRPFGRDDADDYIIAERVRAELGRLVSHPGAIEVSSEQGHVTLAGPVVAREAHRLLSGVRAVRGVTGIEDRLEPHEKPGDVPGLQGNARAPAPAFELLQEHWTPTARLLTSIAGGTLVALALRETRRDDPLAGPLALAGLALLTRASANKPMQEILGVGAGRSAVTIQKTINIDAPVEDVFAWFTDWERWPQWMSHVREVTASGERGVVGERTHWVVDGVAGTTVSWDAEVTQIVPREVVSWKSVPGSAIEHAGTIQFESADDGSTRVLIRMSYNPVVGVIGHAVASLLGRDPKRQMEDDLVRLKTTIEDGVTPHDAAQHTASELATNVTGRAASGERETYS